MVGWLLDARIRKATNGAKSLDDLMRAAFAKFSGAHGYTPEQFKATAAEVAGVSLKDFFRAPWNPPKNSITPKPSSGSDCDSKPQKREIGQGRRAQKRLDRSGYAR